MGVQEGGDGVDFEGGGLCCAGASLREEGSPVNRSSAVTTHTCSNREERGNAHCQSSKSMSCAIWVRTRKLAASDVLEFNTGILPTN